MDRKLGRLPQRQAWSRELLEAEQKGGSERTDRTRYLGSLAALAIAEPLEEAYRGVRLAEPLKKNLKLKKTRMQQVLQAYTVAADYGVAEVATTATYRTAEVYNDFGRALLESQRPKRLSKDELEQYNIMLEEQAFPVRGEGHRVARDQRAARERRCLRRMGQKRASPRSANCARCATPKWKKARE